MRDDFSVGVKEKLAARVGFHCSNPQCRASTSGPHLDSSKVINIGVAAHNDPNENHYFVDQTGTIRMSDSGPAGPGSTIVESGDSTK